MDDNKIFRKTILDRDIEVFQTKETQAAIDAVQDAAKLLTAKLTADKNSFPLRPSSALKSMRDLYYGLVNYYKPNTIPTTAIEGRNCMLLNYGHATEKHLVEHIRGAFEVPYTSFKVEYGTVLTEKGTKPITLGGEGDLIIRLKSGELVLGDSKSSASFPFRKNESKDEHIIQLNLYMHSQFCRDLKINRAWIWYYCKDNSELKIFEFYYDAALAQKTLDRFQKVHDMYEAGTLPPQEHILGVDWQASYSPYRDYEWKAYESRTRPAIVLTEEQTKKLPTDKKELLRYVIVKYGCVTIMTHSGITLEAIKKGSQMFLNMTDADGFSS